MRPWKYLVFIVIFQFVSICRHLLSPNNAPVTERDAPYQFEKSLYRRHTPEEATLGSGTPNVSKLDQSLVYPISTMALNKIPKIFIFNYRYDLFGKQELSFRESNYFENVVRSIRMYTRSWKRKTNAADERVYVWFMDDDECIKAIQLVEPELVAYFQKEKDGSYKSDICRGAALYLTGGYYFDIDMFTIEPVELSDNVTLSVVASDVGGYFNSYMLTSPRHPVVRDYLEILLQFYRVNHNTYQRIWYKFWRMLRSGGIYSAEGHGPLEAFFRRIPPARRVIGIMMDGGLLGVRALEGAVEHHKSRNLSFHVLQETDMRIIANQTRLYPNLTFQNDGEGGCCNYLVEDRAAGRAHFFARFVGAKHTCVHMDKNKSKGIPLPWAARKSIIETLGVKLIKILS